jgi:glycosylphosphatidylinositol deacylase
MNGRPFASSDDADGIPANPDPKPSSLHAGSIATIRSRSPLDTPPSPPLTRSRRPLNGAGKAAESRNVAGVERAALSDKEGFTTSKVEVSRIANSEEHRARKGPWFISILSLVVSLAGISLLILVLYSLSTRQLDPKGCRMSYMRPSYLKFDEFDTEHTRFATKYSLYLYREQGTVDEHVRIHSQTLSYLL